VSDLDEFFQKLLEKSYENYDKLEEFYEENQSQELLEAKVAESIEE
jgi:poly-beta-hydroxyalkanoate depolymerase